MLSVYNVSQIFHELNRLWQVILIDPTYNQQTLKAFRASKDFVLATGFDMEEDSAWKRARNDWPMLLPCLTEPIPIADSGHLVNFPAQKGSLGYYNTQHLASHWTY